MYPQSYNKNNHGLDAVIYQELLLVSSWGIQYIYKDVMIQYFCKLTAASPSRTLTKITPYAVLRIAARNQTAAYPSDIIPS